MLGKKIYFFIILIFVLSCKKEKLVSIEEQHIQEYQVDTVVISGNTPATDTSISDLQVDAFINKSYITLLGRKPNTQEYDLARNTLSTTQFSKGIRRDFLQTVMSNTYEYRSKIWSQFSADILQNTDSNDVNSYIATYDYILSNGSLSAYWPFATYQKTRLVHLKQTFYTYIQGQSSLIESHKALINNVFYDEINMGTFNFVTSSFLYFLNRYPTTAEIQEGSLMVDGFSGVLFFETGHSKDDYVNIFFNADDYFEGQVQDAIFNYLGRNAHTQELYDLSLQYRQDLNYENLLLEVLSTNEFAGITW